jgi:hypothetical protein
MAKLIPVPTIIPAAGEPPKIIEEFIGRVNSETTGISIAKMTVHRAGATGADTGV